MNLPHIRKFIFIVCMILGLNAFAADGNEKSRAEKYPYIQDNYLYYLHNEPPSVVHENGIQAPGSNLNILNLFANIYCDESAYLVLHLHQRAAVDEAFRLTDQTSSPVYIYVVAATYDVYLLHRTLTRYLERSRTQNTAANRAYANNERRLFTATAIIQDMIIGAHIVDRDAPENPWPPYVANPNYSAQSPGINTHTYPGDQPSEEEIMQKFHYVDIVKTSTFHDVCTIQPFMCPASRPGPHIAASPGKCISQNQIVKIPLKNALTYKILPLLFSE